MRLILYFLISSALAMPVLAQVDVAAVGGGGVAFGEEQDAHGVWAAGATIGYPYAGRHRVQFDYLLNGARLTKRHFTTVSYVVQGSAGRTRPFFQIGAGIVQRHFTLAGTDTSAAVVFGVGATVDMGKSFFIRPQVRLYGHVGPTLTLLPSIAAGWRF